MRRDSLRSGLSTSLLKPFTLEAVEKSVKRAIEYRRRLLEESHSEKRMRDGDDNTGHAYDWKIVDKEIG
jgi:DNA-binding NtrC family response regulator